MKILMVSAAILMLIAGLLPVNADGAFLMKQRANLGTKSHARDITERVQKALIIYDKGMEHLIMDGWMRYVVYLQRRN